LITNNLRKIQSAVLQKKELFFVIPGQFLRQLVGQRKAQLAGELLAASAATSHTRQTGNTLKRQESGMVLRLTLHMDGGGNKIVGKLCIREIICKRNGLYHPNDQLTKIKNHGKTPHSANTDPVTQFIPLYLFAFDLSMVFLLFLREKNAFFAKTVARRGEMW
jgi:fructose-specific component phosphotransferase system IIB-like protein